MSSQEEMNKGKKRKRRGKIKKESQEGSKECRKKPKRKEEMQSMKEEKEKTRLHCRNVRVILLDFHNKRALPFDGPGRSHRNLF